MTRANDSGRFPPHPGTRRATQGQRAIPQNPGQATDIRTSIHKAVPEPSWIDPKNTLLPNGLPVQKERFLPCGIRVGKGNLWAE